MKILFGSIVTHGAGRLGGHVVRNFMNKPFITRLALPKRQRSSGQSKQRGLLSQASQVWRSMSSEDRLFFSTASASIPYFDRWGNAYTRSGRTFYTGLAVNCGVAGLPVVTASTYSSAVPVNLVEEYGIVKNPGSIIFYGLTVQADTYLNIYAKRLNSMNDYVDVFKLPFLGSVENVGAALPSAYALLEEYLGTLEVGDIIAMTVALTSTSGLMSAKFGMKTTVLLE